MGAFLTYALDEGGALVHVDDVAKGAKCACHCPHCEAPLYAKNAGKFREHHFAHAHGHECEGAYESQLHLLAKEVLQETGRIMLPPSNNSGQFPTGPVRIRNVEVEKWDERYCIRPDAEGLLENGERLLIEFYVSHKVDSKKRQVIVDNHLKCIEIDINYQALDKAELKQFISGSNEDRKWIISMPPPPKSSGESFGYSRNPMYEKARDVLKDMFDEGTITIHPYATSYFHENESFDLRQIGYDVCEVNTKYRGFKSDLLLYRSQKEKKGYISINIRGRKRGEGFRYPEGLRIIDIVFKSIGSEEGTRRRFNDGNLVGDLGMTIEYNGFKKIDG
jgi:hypothetical protein